MKYVLTKADKESAARLAEVVTYFGILEWIETWRRVKPGHSQYAMKAQQIAIGEYALELAIG